jgi:hypothetical protein
MPGPFIVKTVSRIHAGKAAAYRPRVEEICQLAEEREPRLLAFHIYVTEDEDSEVVVQVHPDAESMQHHLQVLGEKVRATAEYTDFESLEIYGELNDALRHWLPHVTEGIEFTLHSTHGAVSRDSRVPTELANSYRSATPMPTSRYNRRSRTRPSAFTGRCSRTPPCLRVQCTWRAQISATADADADRAARSASAARCEPV